MGASAKKVGMREFRAHLPQYLQSTTPVAITCHGETLGFYIPTKHYPQKTELAALKKAAAILEKLMASHQATEEELLVEFRKLREGDRD